MMKPIVAYIITFVLGLYTINVSAKNNPQGILLYNIKKSISNDTLYNSSGNETADYDGFTESHPFDAEAAKMPSVSLGSSDDQASALVIAEQPNYGINKKCLPGNDDSSAGVDDNGNFCVTIPLHVLINRLGPTPSLCLSYNSARTDGMMGPGWTLTGLSEITTANASVYYDGIADNSDVYYKDGKRLVQESSGDGIVEFMVDQGHDKAVGYITNGKIGRFVVHSLDGNVASYEACGNNFYITELVDLYGQKIKFTYLDKGNYRLIKRIHYGNSSGNIDFYYTSLGLNSRTIYEKGQALKVDEILSGISVNGVEAACVNAYNISYKKVGCQLAVSRIEHSQYGELCHVYNCEYEQKADDKNFYSMSQGVRNYTAETFNVKDNYFMPVAPYAGNNGNSFVVYPRKNPYKNNVKYGYDLTNEYTGDEAFFYFSPQIDTQDNINLRRGKSLGEGFVRLMSSDINGDGAEEIITVNDNIADKTDSLTFTVQKITRNNKLSTMAVRSFHIPLLKDKLQPKTFLVGDFSGNGLKDEVLCALGNNRSYKEGSSDTDSRFYIFNLSDGSQQELGGGVNYQLNLAPENINILDQLTAMAMTNNLYAMDVDGDGREEVVKIEKVSYVSVYKVKEGKLCLMDSRRYDVKLNSNENVSNRQAYIGDFNGDGKQDIVWTSKTDYKGNFPEGSFPRNWPFTGNMEPWYLGISKGDGTFDIKTVTTYSRHHMEDYFMADINRDGITEIVGYDKDQHSMIVRVINHVSTSSHKDEEYSADIVATHLTHGESMLLPYRGGINAASLLAIGNDSVTTIKYGQDVSAGTKLTHFWRSDGFNAFANYRYQVSPRYNTARFPFANQRHGRWIVSLSESQTCGMPMTSYSYTFSNPVLRADGLGFVGYETVSVKDNRRNKTVVKNFDTGNFGLLQSISSPQGSSKYKYNVTTNSQKHTIVTLASEEKQNALTGNTTKTAYLYDERGNATEISTEYSDKLKKQVKTAYLNDISGHYVSLPVKQEEVSINGNSTVSNAMECAYDEVLHKTEIKSYKNKELFQTVRYRYEDNLPVEKTTRLFNSKNVTTEGWGYDEYGRLVSCTDKYGHKTSYEYMWFEKPYIVKDYKNRGTDYKFDMVGNIIGTIRPDSTSETVDYQYSDEYAGAVYKKTTTNTGKPTVVEYYDAMHRIVRKGVQDFDGQYLNTDYNYDDNGRLVSVTLPCKTNTTLKKEYAYDEYDRITESTDPSGGEMLYFIYDGNNRTVVKNGVATEETYDEVGNLVSSDADNVSTGAVVYNYTADGKILSVENSEGCCWIKNYDEFGRLAIEFDPCRGESRYFYDNDGNMEASIDGNGNLTKYRYDKYNRLIFKENNGTRTCYYYDEDGNLGIKEDALYSKNYLYDSFGRPELIVTKTDNGFEEKHISYSNGNISQTKTVLPDKTITEDYTYANGTLAQIRTNCDGDERPSFRLLETDNYGNVAKIATGPLTKTFGYDNANRCTSIRAVLENDGTVEQNLSYTRERNLGLVMYMDDNLNGTSERYGYDEFMRLAQYGDHYTDYFPNGNISKMSRIGTYGYAGGNGNSYALSHLERSNDVYPFEKYKFKFNELNRLASASGEGKELSYQYDGEGNRVISRLTSPAGSVNKYYIDDKYEIVEDNGRRHELFYVGGTPYTAHSVLKMSGDTIRHYYIMRDVMGSVTKIIDGEGNVVQDVSFDAWGNVRDPKTLEYTKSDSCLFLGRGFTGHEHLPMLGLVNMNARIYSAPLGRFISPDPVLNFENGQTLNSYVYANNNPLMYTDPDGRISTLAAFGIYTGFSYLKGSADNHDFNPFKWQSGFVMGTVGVEGLLTNDHRGCYGYMSTSFGNFGGGFYYNSANCINSYTIYQTSGGYDYGLTISQGNALSEYYDTRDRYNFMETANDASDHFGYVGDCLTSNKYFSRYLAEGTIYSLVVNNNSFLKTADYIDALRSNKIVLGAIKYNRCINIFFAGMDVSDGYIADNGHFGYNALKATTNAVASEFTTLYASVYGAKFLGEAGFFIGGPYGALIGAAIGAVGGAVIADYLTKELVDESFYCVYGHYFFLHYIILILRK